MCHLKRFLVKVMHVLMKWSYLGNRLRSKYDLIQIYNADEFSLFYRTQPNKSLYLKNETCVGGKHSKLRSIGLTAANAVGEKLLLFVIGKSKKPWCFKHIKFLPCRYCCQKRSWMDSILFEEWFVKLIDGLPKKDKKLFYWLVIVQPTHQLITSCLLN